MRCSLCRYNKPHDPSPDTHVEVDDGTDDEVSYDGNLLSGDVVRQRSLASLYMNATNFHIFSLTKSNSDLRVLAGISIDYCVKYTSKPQCIDADKVLKAALNAVSRAYKNRALAEARAD
jgi:hypothetical protein